MSAITIRRAVTADVPALTDIYNHYVVNTPITFDLEPRTVDQRMEWFGAFAARGRYQCFVAVRDGIAIGWACSARFKEKQAYETSIETSIYLASGEGGHGLGRLLYRTLFDALADEDVHRAFGGITLPNAASVALHRAFGFEQVGVYQEIGRKFGRYWDVGLFLKALPAPERNL